MCGILQVPVRFLQVSSSADVIRLNPQCPLEALSGFGELAFSRQNDTEIVESDNVIGIDTKRLSKMNGRCVHIA